jgi:hypothetical protein
MINGHQPHDLKIAGKQSASKKHKLGPFEKREHRPRTKLVLQHTLARTTLQHLVGRKEATSPSMTIRTQQCTGNANTDNSSYQLGHISRTIDQWYLLLDTQASKRLKHYVPDMPVSMGLDLQQKLRWLNVRK